MAENRDKYFLINESFTGWSYILLNLPQFGSDPPMLYAVFWVKGTAKACMRLLHSKVHHIPQQYLFSQQPETSNANP